MPTFTYPQKFLGCVPLYIGIELILGISSFNKFSAMYGLLAFFTGHPLSFIQWFFYLYSFICLFFYMDGLRYVRVPNILKYSLILVVFTLDTLLTTVFTFIFTNEWYSSEGARDNAIEKSSGNTDVDTSKSASEAYEFGLTASTTILVLTMRLYFNFVLASWVHELAKREKYGYNFDDVEADLKNKNAFQRYLFKCERWAYLQCLKFL